MLLNLLSTENVRIKNIPKINLEEIIMLYLLNKKLAKIIAMITFSFMLNVYGNALDYQDRGNRWEGITTTAIIKSDIELLSALVDYRENWQPLPANCKLQFYLDQTSEVDLTVQELRPKHNYTMNQVIPWQPWQKGINHYQWSTSEVIAPLQLKITQLGIVASLKQLSKNDMEYIAPVLLYHSTPPANVNGYLFAFKVKDCAILNYVIFQEEDVDPIAAGKLGRQSVGEPFVIHWDSSLAKEGFYELIVDGYFLRNDKPIHQSVQFYHKSSLNKD